MLDAFIIEEIQRREREAEYRREQNRPRQELPIPQRPPSRDEEAEPSGERGVTTIDYSVDETSPNNSGVVVISMV